MISIKEYKYIDAEIDSKQRNVIYETSNNLYQNLYLCDFVIF